MESEGLYKVLVYECTNISGTVQYGVIVTRRWQKVIYARTIN